MNNKNRQEIQNRFSLRKLTIGLVSVSLGMFFMQTSNQAKADTSPEATTANKKTVQTDQTVTTSKDNSTDNGSQELVILATTQADKRTTTVTPATDTTTPIAPSTTVPSYDGTKVVDTPFYNNPQGTNSKLIDNEWQIARNNLNEFNDVN